MLYVFYYLTIGYFNTKLYGNCPVEHFMKKYGFHHFLPIPKSNSYSKNSYLMCVPKVINRKFYDILISEGCHLTYISCQDIESSNLNDKTIEDKVIWRGWYYETIFNIIPIIKTIDV